MVSGSSDTTLKIWDLRDGACVSTIYHHTDYVKALACAEMTTSPVVASAGLDNSFYIWDMNHLVAASETKAGPAGQHRLILSSRKKKKKRILIHPFGTVSVHKAQKSSIYTSH